VLVSIPASLAPVPSGSCCCCCCCGHGAAAAAAAMGLLLLRPWGWLLLHAASLDL